MRKTKCFIENRTFEQCSKQGEYQEKIKLNNRKKSNIFLVFSLNIDTYKRDAHID